MKKKMENNKKKGGGASSKFPRKDDMLAAKVLLSLRRHMCFVEYLSDFGWNRKKRRSALNPIPPLPAPPPPPVVAAEKECTTSPQSAFDFPITDELDKKLKHSSPTETERASGRMDVGIAEEIQAVGPIMAHSSNGLGSVGPIGIDLNELPAEEEEEALDVMGDRRMRCAEARSGAVVPLRVIN